MTDPAELRAIAREVIAAHAHRDIGALTLHALVLADMLLADESREACAVCHDIPRSAVCGACTPSRELAAEREDGVDGAGNEVAP